jgi:hypothetical protein
MITAIEQPLTESDVVGAVAIWPLAARAQQPGSSSG